MTQKKKWWSITSKLTVIILAVSAYGYIINRLLTFHFWDDILVSGTFTDTNILTLCILLILWAINIFSETKKWQALLQPYHFLTFNSAFKQVLAGTVTAVGSPARIAEMGGRMAMLAPQFRVNAAIMTGIGGLMQSLIIFIGGLCALLLLTTPLHDLINTTSRQIVWYSLAIIITFLVIFNIAIKLWNNKIRIYLLTLKKTSLHSIIASFFWTIIRYFIYNIQLYFWMMFFDINPDLTDFIIYSPIYFMLITIVPSYIFIDIGIRGSIALLIFGQINENEPLILASVFAQWLSNVVIPTLLGSFILLRYKVIKQEVI